MGFDVNVWRCIEGETPIDPSGLKDRSIRTRAELAEAEAENVCKAHDKYLAVKPTKRLAPFDYSWIVKLLKEMYGSVWNIVRVWPVGG